MSNDYRIRRYTVDRGQLVERPSGLYALMEDVEAALELERRAKQQSMEDPAAALGCAPAAQAQQRSLPLDEALDHLQGLVAFAYAQGFHELGYDPLTVVREALRQAQQRSIDAVDAARWRFFDDNAQSELKDRNGTRRRFAEWMQFAAVMEHGSRSAAIDHWMDRAAMTPEAPQPPQGGYEGGV